jgi:hypothetical protein
MNLCRLLSVAACLSLVGSLAAAEPTHKVEVLKEAPTGLAPEVTAVLNNEGYRISSAGMPVCDVWLAKSVSMAVNFKPTDVIKYPFSQGQLVGAIRFPAKTVGGDYRGQEIAAGTYTLRYGLQPMDGNHLGTADVRDFLLASPAKNDSKPDPLPNKDDLFKLSAQAAGTTHPTIFLLLPPPAAPHKSPVLTHDADKNLWILGVNVEGKSSGKSAPVPLQLVTIGKTET